MNILPKKICALALGSNLGDSGEVFKQVCQLLQENNFHVQRIAPVIITKPVDCPPGTPDFANSALIGSYSGRAEDLLDLTQSIEQKLGRPADHGFHTPRTCDIDIITFGDLVMKSDRLTIPHPAAQERLFVLEPLNVIAPDLRFPDTGVTVRELLTAQKKSCC